MGLGGRMRSSERAVRVSRCALSPSLLFSQKSGERQPLIKRAIIKQEETRAGAGDAVVTNGLVSFAPNWTLALNRFKLSGYLG
jgi:hypothetical protein